MALLHRLILLASLSLLAGCGGTLMFLPMEQWAQNPSRLGLDYEDVVLIHEQGLRLHGWWLPAQGEPRGTVYFLHGNAQNISTHIMNVRWLPPKGFNVFLLDYRGYGLSDGEPRLPEVLDDIQLGLDWLNASGRLNDKPIVVLGQSLGASMSIPVLAREQNRESYDCFVSEAAFTGYRAVASDVMKQSWLTWFLRPFVLPSMPAEIDPLDTIAQLSSPVLIMHSKEDEVIAFRHGQALYDAAVEPKEFQALLGPHIVALSEESVQRRVLQFVYSRCGVVDVPEAVPVNPGAGGAMKF